MMASYVGTQSQDLIGWEAGHAPAGVDAVKYAFALNCLQREGALPVSPS